MYGIGMPELIALLVIALIVIGPSKLLVGTLVKMNKDQKKKMDSAFRIALGLLLVLMWLKSPFPTERSGALLLLGIALLGFGIYQLTQINKGTSSAGKLQCKKCGEQIGTQNQFCGNCGTGIVLGFKNVVSACECGAEILEGVKFCRQSGRKVG